MSKFTKKINKLHDALDNELKDINLEELDLAMNQFYIDEEKISSIKAPVEMKSWVKDAIDKAEVDINKSKNKKNLIASVASIAIVFSVGVYNPVLAHKIPVLESVLRNINEALKIDEIAYRIGIDNIIPKATLDNNDKIKFITPTKYKVNNVDNITPAEEEIKLNSISENLESPNSEYLEIQFIHKMSNSIINPIDNKKYGNIGITPESIELAIEGLVYIENHEVKTYLQTELNKWKNGKFDNAVEVHNYVWNMLGGQVGKAISINKDKVNEIVKNYFSN